MADLKLYYIPNVQTLVYSGNYELKLENLPMNRFDALLHKSSNNTLDFSVRNKDRKPINLLDKTLTAYITNVETNQLKLTKTLEKLDETKGFARLNLSAGEVNDWGPGFYKYSVVVQEDNGREGFAYVNQVYEATGTFELQDRAIPTGTGGTEVSNFTQQTFGFDEIVFVSSAVTASGTNLHTFAWYMTNFEGTITIEGTMDQTIPTDQDSWATVFTETFTNTPGDGIVNTNATGLYTYFRYVYEISEFNTGTVDKVIYK